MDPLAGLTGLVSLFLTVVISFFFFCVLYGIYYRLGTIQQRIADTNRYLENVQNLLAGRLPEQTKPPRQK